MASSHPNPAMAFAATLVDEWVLSGVTDAVVCPGSRSTPMALALARHPSMSVHVHLDERSGAFVALGLAMSQRRPTIVLTTSGTAAVELHPALVEARHAFVPLIALTADRPPELQGVGAPQTIDQHELFGDVVVCFAEPGPPEDSDPAGWRALASRSADAAAGDPPGPVHLNLAFREPLTGEGAIEATARARATPGVAEPAESPPEAVVRRVVHLTSGRRGLVVAGARAARNDADREAVLELAARLGWPVLADHLSGLRVPDPRVVSAADPLARVDSVTTSSSPEAVIWIGGRHASRVLGEWLGATHAHHVGLDRYGAVPDPSGVLDCLVAGDVGSFCRRVAAAIDTPPTEAGWTRQWRRLDDAAAGAIERTMRSSGPDALTEPEVLDAALHAVPNGGRLVVSSSMPVRDLESFVGPRSGVEVLANRGANGIDGVVSTAIGVALAGAPCVAVVGDLAFLHDSSALVGLARRALDLCIVVIDNDGGGIFSFLPQASACSPLEFEQLFGTPHGTDLASLARAHHLAVDVVVTHDDLERSLSRWRGEGGVRVSVVASSRSSNVEHHRRLYDTVAASVEEMLARGSGG